jgi:hypothetical protein
MKLKIITSFKIEWQAVEKGLMYRSSKSITPEEIKNLDYDELFEKQKIELLDILARRNVDITNIEIERPVIIDTSTEL